MYLQYKQFRGFIFQIQIDLLDDLCKKQSILNVFMYLWVFSCGLNVVKYPCFEAPMLGSDFATSKE